jgi:hypothetical protein
VLVVGSISRIVDRLHRARERAAGWSLEEEEEERGAIYIFLGEEEAMNTVKMAIISC